MRRTVFCIRGKMPTRENPLKLKRDAALTYVQSHTLYIAGFVFLAALGTIYFLSGGNAVVTAHDQLDQFYMPIYVEHFSDGYSPELAYGLEVDEIQTTTWLFNPLYFLLNYAHAYLLNYILVMLVAYVGMALLCSLFGTREWLSVVSALAFSLLPFYCTYGLAIMGMPLMFYCLYSFWLKPNRRSLIKLLICTFIFALGSGLVLSGYIIILILFFLVIFTILRDREHLGLFRITGLLMTLFLLCAIYFWESSNLFNMFFGSDSARISHREEFETSPIEGGLKAIISFVLVGQYHGQPNQAFIAIFATIVTLIAFFVLIAKRFASSRFVFVRAIDQNSLRLCKWIVALFIVAICIACFYVIFNTEPVVSFRNSLPGYLKSFHFDRFYLLYPTIWYLLFGICGELILRVLTQKVMQMASVAAIIVIAICTCAISIPSNDIYQTIERQIQTDESISLGNVTWDEFFGSEIFDEIKSEFPNIEQDGKTASVGLFPSIALYNGFQCLDGYMVSYPLEYKHEFRKIIEGELEKSPALAEYFDKWGSRFYILSSEDRDFFTLKNSDAEINELDIDIEQFSNMGGKYIISALPIGNAKDLGIVLLGKYSNADIPYEIWLYETNN